MQKHDPGAGERLLSDVEGRITHIFFALPAYDAENTQAILTCLRGIRAALGPDLRCTVLHHPMHADAIAEQLGGFGGLDPVTWQDGHVLRLRDVKLAVKGKTLTITKLALPDFTNWVQDAFLVAGGSDQAARIWASPTVLREHGGWDDAVPMRLAEHIGWPLQQLPCALAAGNVLVDQDRILLGADVQSGATESEWRALLEWLEAGERQVVVVAPGVPQALFHLDLYVTLAGVDPRGGKPRALVGSERRVRSLLGESTTASEIDHRLDATAAFLGEIGYRVERLPLLSFNTTDLPDPACYSFNNCLVEMWEGPDRALMQRVTLPIYSAIAGGRLEVLEADASTTWASLGFDVVRAEGAFGRLAELYGSARCMTKVLERKTT
jgi:hypothetical protein